MSSPWRPWVASVALAGFVAWGPGASPARADSAAGDSTAADSTITPTPAAPASPPSSPTPPVATPAPAFHAELKDPPPSRTRAWIALGSGVGLTLGSFFVAKEADQAYDRYQTETDPGEIEGHYQDAKNLDKISAGMLITGQAAIALGIYWGFIKRPDDFRSRRVSIAPDLTLHRAGVAVVVPLP